MEGSTGGAPADFEPAHAQNMGTPTPITPPCSFVPPTRHLTPLHLHQVRTWIGFLRRAHHQKRSRFDSRLTNRKTPRPPTPPTKTPGKPGFKNWAALRATADAQRDAWAPLPHPYPQLHHLGGGDAVCLHPQRRVGQARHAAGDRHWQRRNDPAEEGVADGGTKSGQGVQCDFGLEPEGSNGGQRHNAGGW